MEISKTVIKLSQLMRVLHENFGDDFLIDEPKL